MADLERGQRIKAQREELHLTQPAVVDLLEAAARELPEDHPLHPQKLGKPPVTLRGYQTWEQGGGVAWEKAKLLARVLRTDVAVLINGAATETPDPFPANGNGNSSVEDRLEQLADQIAHDRAEREANITQVKALIQAQNELLAKQDAILEEIRDATAKQQDAARRLERMTQEAVDAMPARPARAPRKAPSGTRSGS